MNTISESRAVEADTLRPPSFGEAASTLSAIGAAMLKTSSAIVTAGVGFAATEGATSSITQHAVEWIPHDFIERTLSGGVLAMSVSVAVGIVGAVAERVRRAQA